MPEIVSYLLELVQGHRSVGMCTIYLAADTHGLIAFAAEELVLGLGVVLAVAKAEDGFF